MESKLKYCARFELFQAMQKNGHFVGFVSSGEKSIRIRDSNGDRIVEPSEYKEIKQTLRNNLKSRCENYRRKGYTKLGKMF